jgi:hypothetical protein
MRRTHCLEERPDLVTDDFPNELKQFIAQHVESLAQLETLLLLYSEPRQPRNAVELARELYLPVDMCQGIVADLERRRLAVRTPADKCIAPSGDVDVNRLVAQLDHYYRERRVAVITEIYSNPQKRVQTFADAFRLRREE